MPAPAESGAGTRSASGQNRRQCGWQSGEERQAGGARRPDKGLSSTDKGVKGSGPAEKPTVPLPPGKAPKRLKAWSRSFLALRKLRDVPPGAHTVELFFASPNKDASLGGASSFGELLTCF